MSGFSRTALSIARHLILNAKVEIVPTQFDSKMAKLLSGAGGRQRQLCTALFSQIHDKEFVREGFPINRFIRDAKNLFEEVKDKEFIALSSDERLNLTNKPIHDKEIKSASPLHAYLRIFGWFMALISHLQSGHIKFWSPTSKKSLTQKS